MLELFLGFALVFYIVFQMCTKPRGYPPGPIRIPLVGYAPWIDQRLPFKTWDKLRPQYGEVLGLYLGILPTVLANGWEAHKEGLYNTDLDYRPESIFVKDTNDNQMLGVMFVNGDFWKTQRRFSLFHLRNLGFGRKSSEAVILEENEEIIKEFESFKQKPFQAQVPLGVSAINILWSIMGGERLPKNDDNLKLLVSRLNLAFRAGQANGGVVNSLTFLRHILPNISGYKTVMEGMLSSKKFLMEHIKEHVSTLDKDNLRDFIDVFLVEMQKMGKHESFTHEQLAALCLDIFNAGTETGSSLVTFCIMFLCLYPEEQRELHEELDEVVGHHRMPNLDDRPRLIRMEAFLNEVLRYRCPAPHSVPHFALKDTTLQGYRIPKGTQVVFNIRSVLMDKEYWGDPDVFRPDRFIQDGAPRKYERMIPFGKGRRACLGEPLARMTSFLTFSALVNHFTFSLPKGMTLEDTEGNTGFTLGPPVFEVIATPRKS